MNRTFSRSAALLFSGSLAIFLQACGGGSGSSGPVAPTSYVGTNGAFVAVADPTKGTSVFLATGIAGKRQYLRGTVDLLTGRDVGQPAGVEVYKGSDGNIHAIDLTSFSVPTATQISNEAKATVDDACTFGGASLPGVSSDYTGIFAAPDYANPVNYSYFYRLPGADGVCNTADDVIHLVHTGMGPNDSPITATAMPAATVYSSAGAITGFVAKQGASLVLLDAIGANPIVLKDFLTTISVATALPSVPTTALPSGNLFVVNGDIVYVDYVNKTVSASLFTIPNWTAQTTLLTAASPSTLYFSIFTAASGPTPASSTVYAVPEDGSSLATSIDTESGGHITSLNYPMQSTQLLFSVVVSSPTSSYIIKALAAAGGQPTTLVTVPQNSGRFVATASTVYYTTYLVTGSNTTYTRSAIQSGIVGTDGTEIQAPTTASEFMVGGQRVAVPTSAPLWETTPFSTVFRISNLTASVTSTTPAGVTYTTPGLSGAVLAAIDTTSNQVVATIGTLPTSNATDFNETFFGLNNVGYIDATNDASTANPNSRDLYLINTRTSNSLTRVTNNL